MPLNYTYTKYKDVYTLQNLSETPLTYTINKEINEQTSQVLVKTGVLNFNGVITLKFPVDGIYTILLDDGENTETFTIKTYNALLLSFITVAEKLLCGCKKCNDCEECNECEDYLGAFMKAFSFNSLNTPIYQDYVNLIPTFTLPAFTEDVVCAITNEKIYGNSSIKEPMLKIVAYYYTAFYFKDYLDAFDAEERAYIDAKYKLEKLSKCIRKLGISIKEIIEEYQKLNLVYYWQEPFTLSNDAIYNLVTNMSYVLSKGYDTFVNFQEGKVIPYTGFGPLVFVITNSNTVDYILKDSVNNIITSLFDFYVVPSINSTLIISKNDYSEGNLFIKIEKGSPDDLSIFSNIFNNIFA
jgi:hypothetical protein